MSSNCVKELNVDRVKQKKCFADSDEDDLLSQAYEDFLLKDVSNDTAPGAGDQTKDADSIFKGKLNDFDLITLEDLLGPSSKTCKEDSPTINKTLDQTNDVDSTCQEIIDFDMTQEDLLVPSSKTCNESLPTLHDLINNDVHQSFMVVKTLRDLALEALNKKDLNKADNDIPESSVIVTIILMDIFDIACKRAKQLKRWRIPNPASWKVNVAKKKGALKGQFML